MIGDVVTHLMAEEAEPIKTEGPVVEEIKEEEPKSDDDDFSDLPDLEWTVCLINKGRKGNCQLNRMIPVIRVSSAASFESKYSAILPGDLSLTTSGISHRKQFRVLLRKYNGRNVHHGICVRILLLTPHPRPHRPSQPSHHQIASLHVQLRASPAQRATFPTAEPHPPLLRQLRLTLLFVSHGARHVLTVTCLVLEMLAGQQANCLVRLHWFQQRLVRRVALVLHVLARQLHTSVHHIQHILEAAVDYTLTLNTTHFPNI